MAKIREIDIAKDLAKEYSTEEIIRFVAISLKNYSNLEDVPERSHFNLILDIIDELDRKLNGQKGPNLL